MSKKGQTPNYNFFETVAILPKTSLKKGKEEHFFYQPQKYEDMIWNLQMIDTSEYTFYRMSLRL